MWPGQGVHISADISINSSVLEYFFFSSTFQSSIIRISSYISTLTFIFVLGICAYQLTPSTKQELGERCIDARNKHSNKLNNFSAQLKHKLILISHHYTIFSIWLCYRLDMFYVSLFYFFTVIIEDLVQSNWVV